MPSSLASASAARRPGPRAAPRPQAVSADALTAAQRNLMIAAIVAAHVAAGYGLMQVQQVRDAVAEVAPLFVGLISPPAPPVPTPPPPPPPPPKPQPILKQPPPAPIIAASPSPSPAPPQFVVPVEPEAETPPPAPAPAPVAETPAPPAPPPPPKTMPASAIQYLVPPPLHYPSASKRLAESGKVMLRVYIDEVGLPRTVQVRQSSGFERLDNAAVAAVQQARFKPYMEDGQPTAAWVLIPLNFDLEN